ncbi:response regulator transcription factor [Terriglobus albidus]|uniref:response regulator transcription factor n=1 Tax=Terriglobus albidus TaxID=1592106 RepID=UPI0021E07AA3|nr:response regulator transcription factor [Terriglobus albidus]
MAGKSDAAESVLIVDDDIQLCDMLQHYLSTHGWRVSTAHTGEEGIRHAREEEPDLLILDVMLPDIEGFEVLRRLHKIRPYRVLLLTARGEEVDRIVGLEMGADDYLGKPFNPRELMARMKAILRRSQHSADPVSSSASSEFRVDARKREIFFRERRIPLTDIEFTLLQYLLGRVDEVVSRDDISMALFERESRPYDRAVDMNISRLRKKLEELSGFCGKIRSIRNSGYMFIMDEEAEA